MKFLVYIIFYYGCYLYDVPNGGFDLGLI